MTHPLVAFALGLLAACSGGDTTPSDTDPTDTDTDTAPDDTDAPSDTDTDTPTVTDTPTHTSDTAGHTGAATTGDTATLVELADLVPGVWRPVSITQNGNTRPVPNDPASYQLFDESGSLAIGCGTAPVGTWTFDPKGPPPSIGILQVDLGFPVSWYVLTLDQQTLVFVEGGDQFDLARDVCP